MIVLVDVTGAMLMVMAMNIMAVIVAGNVTVIVAVVPYTIRMLRASGNPVTKGLLLLIGLHATMVQGSA